MSFRLIPPVETYPAVVRFAQTTAGKLFLLAFFGMVFTNYGHSTSWLSTGALAVITFLPQHRRSLVAFFTIAIPIYESQGLRSLAWILACLAVGTLLFYAARKWPKSAFGRRPILFLLTGFASFIVIACLVPKSYGINLELWTGVGLFSSYVWFIGYALLDRSADFGRDLKLEVGTFRPFWGSTNTPFPKGAAYLRRIEAHNSEELAITQLKGVKLLVWAMLISLFSHYWYRLWHGYAHIPTLAEAIGRSAAHSPAPIGICWVSLLLAFFESIFWVCILGHPIIACCRMAGFRALRNTYRPLSSVTLWEYFNRFYLYFKELLVDFFFYPTFLRYFKRYRRLRMVAATFAAAAFGNAFYHFTRDWQIVQEVGLRKALVNFQVYIFYCVALGTALSVSQLRRRRHRSGFVRGRLIPLSCVILFYSLLDIFGSTQRNYPLVEHLRFLGYLFHISF